MGCPYLNYHVILFSYIKYLKIHHSSTANNFQLKLQIFSCVILSLRGLYNQFFVLSYWKHQEYTNIQTSRKDFVNIVLLKHLIFLARHTGQLHKRWFLCWVCSKIQVAQYHVLSRTQRQIFQNGGRSYWYSFYNSSSFQPFTASWARYYFHIYHSSQRILLTRIYLLLKQCTL